VARLTAEQIDEIARRAAAGEAIPPEDLGALCSMAHELVRGAPSQELIRLSVLLVSSRGVLPLKPADAEALGAAVLRAAEGILIDQARRALEEARTALVLGRNWIDGLDRVRVGSRIGRQLPGLARSMTKTMHRHLTSTAEPLNFGMAAPLEALSPSEPGYKEALPLEQIRRRECSNELERAREALRVARLGILKIARLTQLLSSLQETRVWDEALAQHAASAALDANAHLAELAPPVSRRA
jgi:hypothetical protein